MTFVAILFILLVGFFLYFTNEKIQFIKDRSKAKKIEAQFVGYRSERVRVERNHYTHVTYPYVRLDLESEEYVIRKFKSDSIFSKTFIVGEKFDVFWSGNDLLHWNAMDHGLFKYLPEKWDLIR